MIKTNTSAKWFGVRERAFVFMGGSRKMFSGQRYPVLDFFFIIFSFSEKNLPPPPPPPTNTYIAIKWLFPLTKLLSRQQKVLNWLCFYAPNFEKVRNILVFACACVHSSGRIDGQLLGTYKKKESCQTLKDLILKF